MRVILVSILWQFGLLHLLRPGKQTHVVTYCSRQFRSVLTYIIFVQSEITSGYCSGPTVLQIAPIFDSRGCVNTSEATRQAFCEMSCDKMLHDPQDIEITNQVHLVRDAEGIFLKCREIHLCWLTLKINKYIQNAFNI